MTTKTRSTLMSLFFTVMVAGTVVYIFAIKEKKQKNGYQAFEPTSVVKFGWQTPDVAFEFIRSDKNDTWLKLSDSSRVNLKIETLSLLKVHPMDVLDYDIQEGIGVQITFRDGNTWRGVFVQDSFMWLEGPLAEQGTKLSTSQLEMFQEGKFAFESLVWNWCGPHLKSFVYESSRDAIMVNKVQGKWESTNLAGGIRPIDSNWLGAWIAKSCVIQVSAWIDLNMFPFGLDDGELEVTQENNDRLEYSISAPSFRVNEERAAVSPELMRNLEELVEIK